MTSGMLPPEPGAKIIEVHSPHTYTLRPAVFGREAALIRTGIGFDVHRFAEGRRLVLGGVEIPERPGLEGHSDADVLCHALADALLGAVGDGDIGVHFPNTEPAWKDACSLHLLAAVAGRVRARGWSIVNVDASVLAERPRLRPYVAEMRARLAEAAGIGADQVSVKATTMEQLGAIGRREGIAVMAIATIERDGAE
jgi:2-C-methyl-D-erythritol 2,4-cyclodiphosphate synthase